MSFQIVHPRPDLLDRLLDEVFRVEASGWKARAGTALERDEAVGKFFRRYAARAARLGILRLGFMRIGEAVAAVRLDVEWGQRSWDLKIGYDERFGDCSPGLLLSHEALLHGASRGLEAHHFLGEYEPWHDCWDAEQSPRSTLRHYGLSAAGSVALAGDAASRLRGKLGAFWLNRRVTPVMGGMQIVQELPLPI